MPGVLFTHKKAPPIAGGAWKQVDESSQLHALVFHGFRQGGAHLGRGLGDHDARFAQGFPVSYTHLTLPTNREV